LQLREWCFPPFTVLYLRQLFIEQKLAVAFYVFVWYGKSRKNTCKEERYMFIFAAILFVILTVGVTGVFTMMDACM